MALICNCRGIGEKAIALYLKDRQGQFVAPKEIFNACSGGSASCCARKSECNTAIKDIVKAHNEAVTPANDAATETPRPPQYGHN